MTCKIERWGAKGPEGTTPGQLKSMSFHCDGPDCDASPSDEDIERAGGLTTMGWECTGGRHYCPAHRQTPLTGVQAISVERARQLAIEGWTPESDQMYARGELARAAACYALGRRPPGLWPWGDDWWKPTTPERNLEKAGALIAADLDRIKAGGKSG